VSEVVNIHAAKTHLSRLVQSIRDGQVDEIVIAVGGKPSARLVSIDAKPPRRLGQDAGLIWISEDFDSNPDEIADLFDGVHE